MISRSRKQNIVRIYCKEIQTYIKYKSVDDVIVDVQNYEQNFGMLIDKNKIIDIDDTPYRTMYYNYKYMDNILKTNVKEYLIDMLINKGYNIVYDETYKKDEINDRTNIVKDVKENIVNLLNLDGEKLSEFERLLTSDDTFLEKHFNLRILLKNKIDERLIESIKENLFIETINNKYTKIKICSELMTVLKIKDLHSLDKKVVKKFTKKLDNKWISENIGTIKKLFDIRTDKYDDYTYYNMYLLMITILKNMIDGHLFLQKFVTINYIQYSYYIFNEDRLLEHISIIQKYNKYYN